jgi:hypothetical protein
MFGLTHTKLGKGRKWGYLQFVPVLFAAVFMTACGQSVESPGPVHDGKGLYDLHIETLKTTASRHF